MVKMLCDIAKITAPLDDPTLETVSDYIVNFADFANTNGIPDNATCHHRQLVYATNLLDIAGLLVGFKMVALPGLILSNGVIDKLGLYQRIMPSNRAAMLSLRYNQSLADEACELVSNHQDDSPNKQYRLGELFGYPRTATEYFVERQQIYHDTGKLPPLFLPDEISTKYRSLFVRIVISPDHWRDELVYARKMEAAAMALFSKIYAFLVNNVRTAENK